MNSTTVNEGPTNYARLCTLIMQEGTKRIQANVVGNLIDQMTLPQALAAKKPKFVSLRQKKVINMIQYNALFPDDSPQPQYEAIDMTLWILLARHLSRGKNHINWTRQPNETNIKWQHDVLRIREIRNRLFHLAQPELNQAEFNILWSEAESALFRLGASPDTIQSYKSRDLDPMQTSLCLLQVREQVLEERHGVYMMEAKRRRHTCGFALLFALTALILTTIIVTPLVLFLKPKTSCGKYLQQISTSKYAQWTQVNQLEL